MFAYLILVRLRRRAAASAGACRVRGDVSTTWTGRCYVDRIVEAHGGERGRAMASMISVYMEIREGAPCRCEESRSMVVDRNRRGIPDRTGEQSTMCGRTLARSTLVAVFATPTPSAWRDSITEGTMRPRSTTVANTETPPPPRFRRKRRCRRLPRRERSSDRRSRARRKPATWCLSGRGSPAGAAHRVAAGSRAP